MQLDPVPARVGKFRDLNGAHLHGFFGKFNALCLERAYSAILPAGLKLGSRESCTPFESATDSHLYWPIGIFCFSWKPGMAV